MKGHDVNIYFIDINMNINIYGYNSFFSFFICLSVLKQTKQKKK